MNIVFSSDRSAGVTPNGWHGDTPATPVRWVAERSRPAFTAADVAVYVPQVGEPVHLVSGPDLRVGLGVGGRLTTVPDGEGYPLLGTLAPLRPEWLGDHGFCVAHGLRFPYVAGEMANGIASTRMVAEMARAGMLGFFGSAGLSPLRVELAVEELSGELMGMRNWGVNLIHSPSEPAWEQRVAEILLRHRVPCVSASAFLRVTPAVVRCAASGLRADGAGRVIRATSLFAKVSRPEVAVQFLSPAPPEILRLLVERGQLSAAEAELAARVPVATDVTVEADSGGHTDNRPLTVLLPAIRALRDELAARWGYHEPPRVGAAGGLGDPSGVAGAFALGAAYVLTGSVNQAAVEAGVSAEAKAMLATADIADVIMTPSADMFEMGVRVQVLRRGTLFGVRAARLYEAYRAYSGLDAMPERARTALEREVLGATVDEVWQHTVGFWTTRDPAQLERARADPKHRMALVFRWYLGSSSRWAIDGVAGRRADYQLWCGPAMGAFNRWAAGSFLAEPANRTVVQIARNLLEGAAVITRAHQLRSLGVDVPPGAFAYAPRPLS